MSNLEPKKLSFNINDLEVISNEKIEAYERQQEIIRRQENYERYKNSGVPEKFFETSLDTYITKTEEEKRNLKIVKDFTQNPKNKILLLCGNNGNGKEEWVEQKIPTPQGFRRFGDLKIGDYVYNADGKPTMVLGIYPQGVKDSYRVTFSDGRSDECGLEHLWGVYTRSHGKWKYQVLSLKDMLEKGIKNSAGFGRFYIDSSPVIEGEEKNLPCDPYILGSFIGNGSTTCERLTLSSSDEWQAKKCASILGCEAIKYSEKNYNWLFLKEHAIKTKDVLPKEICCLAHKKNIPQEYIFASVEQRKALLQGLFDTDGCAYASGSRLYITYSTSSKQLSEDVRMLLLTFGIVSTINDDKRKDRINYLINVNCDAEKGKMLFSLPRKLKEVNNSNIRKGSHRDYTKVKIKSVKKLSEKKEMMCIYVGNERHLYLTKDFIVTHNTHLLSGIIRECGGEYVTSSQLCVEYEAAISYHSKRTREEILRHYTTVSLLVIDECGKYTLNEKVEQFILAYIFCTRYENDLATGAATNAEKKSFIEFLGKSVYDRFTEVCTTLDFTGPSKRKDRRII